jgi:Zn-dependent metalloprotease
MRKASVVSWVCAFVLLLVGSSVAGAAEKENGKPKRPDVERGLERLQSSVGGQTQIRVSRATGTVRFLSVDPDVGGDLMAAGGREARTKASVFLNEYAGVFGLRDARELVLGRDEVDDLGSRHMTYHQVYRGVPVFAGMLRTHFSADGALTTVNGVVIPDLDLDVAPSRPATEASAAAIRAVSAANGGSEVFARSGLLMVYRTGLAKGVPGTNHLVYQIEVGNDVNIREFVYVDAHSGKIVDRLPGIYDALNRRAFDGAGANPGPNYPGNPLWVEGDPLPTGVTEADNMIVASKETYDFFKKPFGRDSYDGSGITMDAIFNRGGPGQCPNASWNGAFISFCPGFTSDDVTGHEWGHAYTEYMHGLIYEWQSGALNESYSDIWGETIDRINGRDDFDFPAGPRAADSCSLYFGAPPPVLTIIGGSAAGTYPSQASASEPPLPVSVGPAALALSVPAGACTAITSDVSGKIAVIDWTLLADGVTNECGSGARATNAFNAGAVGIIFKAPPAGLLNLGSIAAIASVEVTHEDGETIKAGLPANATIVINPGTEDSVRWLIGEDDTAPGLFGALRDMWNPRCFGNPGKVSDSFEYVCDLNNDGGGVHTNSGIPNHAYALLVDGGSYNGQNIQGIGLTKASHIYFRAADRYQFPATDFVDHADALERSALDLLGKNLKDLRTGNLSGQRIGFHDILQLKKAIKAVELRRDPPCNFDEPQLAQDPPRLCPSGLPLPLFIDIFEIPAISEHIWTVSHEGETPDFTERDWDITSELPDRFGKAFFAPDQDYTCNPFTFEDETVVLHLDSPEIRIPSGVNNPRLTFVHWFATEPGFDGGNVRISVNGGPWTLIANGDFIYNGYTQILLTGAQGNSNPLAGQTVFAGTDDGQSGGTWGRSIVNLAPYAHGGDKVRIRFDAGNDSCAGRTGWFIDDVLVYKCR